MRYYNGIRLLPWLTMNFASTFPFLARISGFSRFVGRRLINDRCLESAGSLTYTTLLAVVPLFTIALTLISAFPMFSINSGRFRNFILTNLVPEASGKVIGVYMRQFADNAGSLTAAGMIGLVATALLLMFTIEKTFNTIWRVDRPRKLLSRTLTYWATLTLAPILIGLSLSLTSWFSQNAGLGGINFPALKLSSWLLIFSTLSLLYLTLPNCFVPRSHALTAALITSTCLELMKVLFGEYIKQFATYNLVYGAFASFPIFLIWLYLCWVLILAGAVLSATLSYWYSDGWRWDNHHGTRFEQAVRVLRALAIAHKEGQVLHINQLRRQVELGVDATQHLLEQMIPQHWVESTRNGEWLIACSPEKISLLAVFELVVSPLNSEVESGLESRLELARSALDLSLADYLANSQPDNNAASIATSGNSPI
jgi:membrane protein